MSRTYIHQKIEVRKKKSDGSFSSSAIELTNAIKLEVVEGIGKKKDTFKFDLLLPRDNVFETFYDGDNSTVAFTLQFGPIDSDFVQGATKKVDVYVGGVLQAYTTDYTISSSTLTFVSAPSTGTGNIKVVFPVVEDGDLIRIYQWKNAANETNSDVLIEGTVEEPETEITPSVSSIFKVKGTGIIENLLAALVFVRNVALVKPHTIVQDVITQINNYNRLRTIYGESSGEWSNIGNATTKSDSSAFADIQYTSSYKSALEVIEEVSSDRYTKDGNYYFFVQYDAANDRYEFNWKFKDPALTAGLSIVEGTHNIKESKNRGEVINAIIYNVGVDAYEVPQEFLNFSQTSMVGHSTKWKYLIETNHILSDLITSEFEADSSLFDTGADGNRISNFPKAAEIGTWTFQFETRNADGTLTGTNATATSNTEYNDALVEEARWRGKEASDRILTLFAAPKIKLTATLPFDRTFTLGNLVPITSESFNLDNYPLRVIEIKYNDTKTILTFEEDETTAIERIVAST